MIKLISIIVLLIPTILFMEVLIAMSGKKEEYINPGKNLTYDVGKTGVALRYVVIGDSTSAGQGAKYEDGIAIKTAEHLGKTNKVAMTNVSVSGAKLEDIVRDQLDQAIAKNPDIVLISAGANDVTKLSSNTTVENNLVKIVDKLIASNCKVKIVLTGSPDMGAAPRLPQPLRYIAGLRALSINKVFDKVIEEKKLTFARVAEKTGETFRKNPGLFAIDRYHPNEEGYGLFIKVINDGLDEALKTQSSHCDSKY